MHRQRVVNKRYVGRCRINHIRINDEQRVAWIYFVMNTAEAKASREERFRITLELKTYFQLDHNIYWCNMSSRHNTAGGAERLYETDINRTGH